MRLFKTAILFSLFLLSIPAFSQKGFDKIFVDQEWFQEHRNDENLILLHVGTQKSYDEGHIAGAQLIEPNNYTQVKDNLYWELPEVETLKESLLARGVTNKSKVVLYYGVQTFAATFRLYFTLDYFGLSKNVRILDGGLKGWKANDLQVSTDKFEKEAASPNSLTLRANTKLKADKDEVLANNANPKVNIIDARRANYYTGSNDAEDNYNRSGHIEGASNICWLDIVDENHFLKDRAELSSYWQNIGAEKKNDVIAYCHVGLRASVIFTISKALGYDVKLYDGSYNEWDTLDENYPVKKGSEKR